RWSVLRRSLALGLSGRFSRRLLFNLRLSFCGSRVHENRPLSFAVEQLDAPNGSCQVSARLVVFIKRRNAVFVRAGESALRRDNFYVVHNSCFEAILRL